ncbi:MAG: hypothetical protein IKW74_04880 [Thermoguttaceae bacterium]|nr:hypothetical protein [Thermoguttaceae bacterium]
MNLFHYLFWVCLLIAGLFGGWPGFADDSPTDNSPLEIQVDFNQVQGTIKPLHGINNSPMTYGQELPELKAAGIPYSRLHDTAGAFGGTYFVDIPNIFPDFDADPDDPASYDFAFTDAYLAGLAASGIKVFYRLGVTIENNARIKAYRIHPPKDYQKWAKICEMIIRHYNEGWADGFHYNIEYWEIWNEPENPPMWTGTREEYFELYRVASRHLKAAFPDIKVGGYAGCGFYGINRPDASEFQMTFLTWFDEFLKFVTAEETRCPLDFYSWHLYTFDPEEIILHAEYVDRKLKEFNLNETENIFNEWNYTNGAGWTFDLMKEMPGAAFVASAFCLMQDSPIDKAMYYDALPSRRYGGLYYYPSLQVSRTYYSFMAFNELYRLGTEVKTTLSDNRHCYACAAKDENSQAAILLVNNTEKSMVVNLQVNGQELKDFCKILLDSGYLYETVEESVSQNEIPLPALSVVVLKKSK